MYILVSQTITLLNSQNYTYSFYITDNVPALMDAWLIGDDFLKDIIGDFYYMRTNAIKQRMSTPYLFDFYNVHGFYGSTAWGINHFLTPLVDAFNEHQLLPRLIILVFDKDIIANMNNKNINTSLVQGAVLHYMVWQVDVLIDKCKADLIIKKPGALLRFTQDKDAYPKIIWVHMIKRHGDLDSEQKNIAALRSKFNNNLEERLLDGSDRHRIISIEVNSTGFTGWGSLNASGKIDFWNEINIGIRKFEENKVTLKPRKNQMQQSAAHNQKPKKTDNHQEKDFVVKIMKNHREAEKRCKLKTPPPKQRSHKGRGDHHHRRSRSASRNRHDKSPLSKSFYSCGHHIYDDNEDHRYYYRHHSHERSHRHHHKH